MSSFKLTIETRDGFADEAERAERLASIESLAGLFDPAQAAKGAAHEFGTRRIPARPWMSAAVDGAEAKIGDALERAAAAVLEGASPDTALDSVGALVVDTIRASVYSGSAGGPPLDSETAKREGQTTPLVDTGSMLDALEHRIAPAGRPDADG